MVPLGVDLLGVFGGDPAEVQGPVRGGEQVGFGQAAVVVTHGVDAGVEGLRDVGGGVQHVSGVGGEEVEQRALFG